MNWWGLKWWSADRAVVKLSLESSALVAGLLPLCTVSVSPWQPAEQLGASLEFESEHSLWTASPCDSSAAAAHIVTWGTKPERPTSSWASSLPLWTIGFGFVYLGLGPSLAWARPSHPVQLSRAALHQHTTSCYTCSNEAVRVERCKHWVWCKRKEVQTNPNHTNPL
jgi:hypothetical protein